MIFRARSLKSGGHVAHKRVKVRPQIGRVRTGSSKEAGYWCSFSDDEKYQLQSNGAGYWRSFSDDEKYQLQSNGAGYLCQGLKLRGLTVAFKSDYRVNVGVKRAAVRI